MKNTSLFLSLSFLVSVHLAIAQVSGPVTNENFILPDLSKSKLLNDTNKKLKVSSSEKQEEESLPLLQQE